MAPGNGAKMEQKKLSTSPTFPPSATPAAGAIGQPEVTPYAAPAPDDVSVGGEDLPRLIELLDAPHASSGEEIPPSLEESLTGLAGLKLLAAAMTIFLT